MKRRAPDHQCHGVPVLRDVAPHKVPVAVGTDQTIDLDRDLVACMELSAKVAKTTFAHLCDVTLHLAIAKGYRKELGQ